MDVFPLFLLLMLAWLAFLFAARPEVQRMRRLCAAPREPVVTEPERLEERSQPIGRYAGREIYASVKFMGRRYRFDGVASQMPRERIEPRQLFVEPGLLYRLDG